jgi:hypothetical protein
MFNKKSTLLGAVIGIAIGLFGANAAQINYNSQQVMTNGLVEGTPIYGHITVIAKDPQGHIYAYRQSDNLITNMGLNCMAYALFRTAITTGTTPSDRNACGGTGTATNTALIAFNTVSGFRELQIGTSSVVPDATQSALVGGLTAGSAAGTAVPTLSDLGSATTGTTPGVGAIVIISLSNLAVTTTQTVQEAGLFDTPMSNSATGNMFARQTFASVAMTPGDTLTVTWQITLAHG